MKYIRRWLYRWGYRPKPGSIWYSPSLHWIYAFKGMDWSTCIPPKEEKDE